MWSGDGILPKQINTDKKTDKRTLYIWVASQKLGRDGDTDRQNKNKF